MSLSENVKNYQRINQCISRWDTGGMFVLAYSDQREVIPKKYYVIAFCTGTICNVDISNDKET